MLCEVRVRCSNGGLARGKSRVRKGEPRTERRVQKSVDEINPRFDGQHHPRLHFPPQPEIPNPRFIDPIDARWVPPHIVHIQAQQMPDPVWHEHRPQVFSEEGVQLPPEDSEVDEAGGLDTVREPMDRFPFHARFDRVETGALCFQHELVDLTPFAVPPPRGRESSDPFFLVLNSTANHDSLGVSAPHRPSPRNIARVTEILAPCIDQNEVSGVGREGAAVFDVMQGRGVAARGAYGVV